MDGNIGEYFNKPDWSHTVQIYATGSSFPVGSTYMAPDDGWIVGWFGVSSGSNDPEFTVNGITVASAYGSSGSSRCASINVKVNKGDILKLESTGVDRGKITFVYHK